ncbi:hypothetical protein [Propionibacterium freudenreichii]|uniref:hypothetical protein n=1 Tax=Propionibacterium freudenreichii TaxID=1744 RepID=UPI000DEEBB20|nr:hypothetical protein [Propionibacterium freudenreichii]
MATTTIAVRAASTKHARRGPAARDDSSARATTASAMMSGLAPAIATATSDATARKAVTGCTCVIARPPRR